MKINDYENLLPKDDGDPKKYALDIVTGLAHRTIFRLWVLVVLLVVLLVGSNVAWIVYETQYQTVQVTQQNDNSPNNFIGGDGDITNGNADDTLPSP